MRKLQLFRKSEDRPTLKERAATLKARLAQIARRRDGGTNSQRRAMVAGSLAAALPLPALAAVTVSGPHPDQAVLDAEAAMLAAERAYYAATDAHSDAHDAVWAELGICPAELIAIPEELGALEWPGAPRVVWRTQSSQWVKSFEGDETHDAKAWTAPGLRNAIEYAVPMFGRGGQTPHRIRRWKALLPIAETFDARRAEIEQRHRLKELSKASKDTYDVWTAAQALLNATPATTIVGLAAVTRHVGLFGWDRMGPAWVNFLNSAANASGVDLEENAARSLARRHA